MKKITTIILIICLFVGSAINSATVSAGQKKMNLTYGDYVYNDIITEPCVVEHYNELTRYNGKDEHVIVPDYINGVPVYYLMKKYKYPKKIKEITLGRNIRNVYGAFNSLPNLEKINVEYSNSYFSSKDGVLYDEDDLIRYPRGKEGQTFQIPKKVDRILSYAFYGCNNLNTIILSEKLWTISDSAFENCKNLKKIELPERLMYIEENAFSGCSSLKKIKIPKNVYMIKTSAFDNCKAKIKMPSYMKKKKDEANGEYYELMFKATYNNKTSEYAFTEFERIKAAKKKIVLQKDKKEKLVTKIFVDDVWQTLKTNMVYFSSSDEKVATVTGNGTVKGKKKGSAMITATIYYGGNPIRYKVKVQVK